MKDIFITDSSEKYNQSKYTQKIFYQKGFIKNCSFISHHDIEDFNNSLMGFEDEAYRLMLRQLDEDIEVIVDTDLRYSTNRFISRLSVIEKAYSTLYYFHKHFVFYKYLFQLVIDSFLNRFSLSRPALHLLLSEDHYLTQDLSYDIKSASYYSAFENVYFKFLIKQVFYFFHGLFFKKRRKRKTNIAVFVLDIPNGTDLFTKFLDLVNAQDELTLTLVMIDSGNPNVKKFDISKYKTGNIDVIYLYKQKETSYSNYSDFYSICKTLNPLYSIYKKARLCEMQETQYGFTDNIISTLSPDVCIYGMTHEYGRVLANVCSYYNIPSICVDYASLFDVYFIEKRIKFDVRACISEISSFNWRKHNDPTPRHEVIGFCKIDEWHQKLEEKKSKAEIFFENNKKTILFASTWAPNPNSPILMEKVKIAEQLSEMCERNGWNLIIKKHPAEHDNLIADIFNSKSYGNQKVFEHHEMPLFDCIYHSDFVCTQNSTAYVEALYLNKPFSYITLNGENTLADMSYFSKEREVGKFNSINNYEQYILANVEDVNYKKLQAEFLNLQGKYLYKTDGKASERLLGLTKSFLT